MNCWGYTTLAKHVVREIRGVLRARLDQGGGGLVDGGKRASDPESAAVLNALPPFCSSFPSDATRSLISLEEDIVERS